MREIEIEVRGYQISQPQAQEFGRLLAEKENLETVCVARYDREADASSPCCLKGAMGDKPGWEIYGESHVGRLKITVNHGEFVFIFS